MGFGCVSCVRIFWLFVSLCIYEFTKLLMGFDGQRGGLHPVVSHKSDFGRKKGNKTARAVKLGTVRGLVGSAMKGFMKKVHKRPWFQDYVKSLEAPLPFKVTSCVQRIIFVVFDTCCLVSSGRVCYQENYFA